MYTASAHLIWQTAAMCLFALLCLATGVRAYAREKFMLGWVLALCLLLPLHVPALRVEIPQSTAERLPAQSTAGESAEPEPPPSAEDGTEAPGQNAAGARFPWHKAACALYALGVFITLFCILSRYCRAVKALRRCGRAPTERESDIFARLCREQGLRKTPVLLVCPEIALSSSVTFGVARQTVIIAEKFAEEDFALILGHEITHCKRKDAVFKAVLTLLCAFYWFNPMVHVFSRMMDEICEQSCDEQFLRKSSFEEKKRYCRLLVETALSNRAEKKFLFSAFRGGKKVMKQRIQNILGTKSKAITAFLVVTVLLVTALTSAIYLATPPENIKVAHFTEPEQLKDVSFKNDVIENHISDRFHNIKYDYSVDSDEIEISGIIDGKNFKITSKFLDTSYNGARLIYVGEDKYENYDVKMIRFQFAQTTEYTDLPLPNEAIPSKHKFLGWFADYAKKNPKYKNVLEINLNPVGTDDIIIIEIFLEDDFITEYITKNNIKCVDQNNIMPYEGWTIPWCKEHGVKF